ncbi:OmpA family protein [Thioclava sp. GXIMD4216]|uniref:OmpA family protein n=1 Tax=Thioclava litoralis TaxID=3076557 RepID=A0ABZ1E2H9_9RHOB|nr:OmpA family protein [Thioclava sp. FTW29]
MHGSAFTLTLCAAALTLAGCSQEIGNSLGSTGYGSATAHNLQVMTNPQDFAVNLNSKFNASVPTTINFAFNSAVLTPEARAILAQQAKFIRQFPEVRFRVYGHTDLVGSNAYNKALGLRRAKAAVNYLTSQGISRSRLEAIVSYGKTQPLVLTNAPNEQNRRTVTEVSGFVESNPMVMNGKYAQIVFRDYVTSAQPPTQLTGGESTSVGTVTGAK